ncbi:lysozyme inhibitor LprI family protein [Ralstonia flatus]|uniref:Lysozyme inhibitor LprI-like N-terminal domain-containing protein n=1 Tax=Ralstonia flatus TaxID=3058601 RepID=A0AAD2F9B9_9RALS|nr:lysozyme inhibitor LprI family protein [Ralstonia sp. LMG 32965]MBN6208572.1 DUF1311 domain-containing protein [Ralstonia pickettii]CAJ0878023.1 hypothetical protein R77567_03075 [Ralstonia sp. LMG 32965]CAJ0885461.1 hypothetical protein R77564_03030 [Ralstonia sp. LMG 32965]
MALPTLNAPTHQASDLATRRMRGVVRTLSVAAALLLPLAAWAADPIDDALEQCLKTPRGETTAGMTECTHTAYQAYDRQMNALYQAVMSKTDPVSREAIRNAQRAWLAYRNAQKAADNAPWRADAGSVASADIEGLNVEAIRARIAELEYYPH